MCLSDSDVPPEGLITQGSPELEDADSASEANLDGSICESSTNGDESDMDTNNDDLGGDTHNLNEDTYMDQPAAQGLPHHDTAEPREKSSSPVLSPVETGVPVVDVENLEEFGVVGHSESSHTLQLEAPVLLATHQTEFIMDALPTRRGRPRRT